MGGGVLQRPKHPPPPKSVIVIVPADYCTVKLKSNYNS